MDRPGKPESPEQEKIPVGPRRKISEIKETIPPKYLNCVKDNKLLADCCRDVDTSFISTFKSNPDIEGQDLVEIQCDKCEKKQYRTFINVGRVESPAGA